MAVFKVLLILLFSIWFTGCAAGDGSSSFNIPQSTGGSVAAPVPSSSPGAVALQVLVSPGGRWGGSGINMVINSGGAILDLNCAHATLLQSINLDANNRFEVGGIYVEAQDHRAHPARFIGLIDENSLVMSLNILLTDRFKNQTVGSFDLVYGSLSPSVRCSR